ncbi:MAG: glycosyltransferase [Candidatus Binatia bacterium]
MEAENARQSDALSWPSITIIIPVRNAEQILPHCIRGVLSQAYPRDKFEAIFVDNASRDKSLEVLRHHKADIVILQERKRGASAARNTGIRRAKYDYVAFTDSDCIPDPTWLQEFVLFARLNPQADFIGGRIAPFNPQSSIERFVEKLYNQRSAIQNSRPPYAITANLFIKKGKLFELGLFNESFLRGQDVDLSFRGFRQGSTFAYVHQAVVYHANTKTLGGLFRKGFQHGQAATHIWKYYAQELQRSRFKQCTNVKPYRVFIAQLASYLKYTVWPSPDSNEVTDVKTLYPFYDAVHMLGRQFGFLAGTMRRP